MGCIEIVSFVISRTRSMCIQSAPAYDAGTPTPRAPSRVGETFSLARPFQYSLPATSFTAQSRPSSSPAPVMAEHARMLHL